MPIPVGIRHDVLMDPSVLEVLHGITSQDANTRERSAEGVTDVHRGLPTDDIASLVRALVDARLVEESPKCQEAQLHALAELAEWHQLPQDAVGRLRGLAVGDDPSQAEYLADLLRESE